MFNIIDSEEKVRSYWKEHKIDHKVREKIKNGKKFYFLDGPPYVTGDLHPGQMWVKTIKDITMRYKRFRGFHVRDRAGFDVHGLPIENKVEKLLNVGSKKDIEATIGIENFVKKCREYVDSYMGNMDKDFERFGITLDVSNPYLAYRSEYIETGWSILKNINDKGFLYRGLKTTAFCTHCGTALAQGSMEVVYADTDDPSIFVIFNVDKKSNSKIQLSDNTNLLIWTTTPWTLPANVAVAVNPKELYVLAIVKEREIIVAKQRLDAVAEQLNESVTIKQEFYGSELLGTRYFSPLEDKIPMQKEIRKSHKVIGSEELVSMSEGTGLVHIAPGHGLEDFAVGKQNKLPVVSPVNTDGTYTDEAGEYKGLKVPIEANKRVLDDLKASGVVLSHGSIRHSYPHCWRCDTKLIYLATEQWFFNIQKIKKKMITQNSKVVWHPPEAGKWQEDVLNASPDWCISRQRYWGIPLPIWTCTSCKNETLIGSLRELKEKAVDKHIVESLSDLHRPYIDKVKLKCDKCSAEMKRIPDVIDVWYDASIAFRASMTELEFAEMFPMDYIIEGKDQLRGWFSYLMKTSIMAYGKKPYKEIGVDGMLLDEKGKEMHKKLGNYVPLDDIIKTIGADTFRLWCTNHTPWLDLNYNKAEIKDAGKCILILYNASNLLSEYKELTGYTPTLKNSVSTSKLNKEDLWILSRLESTLRDATSYFDNYEGFNAADIIKRFITEDFSRFYLKIAKKRITEGKKSQSKAIVNVINYILYKSLVMISPITPFVADNVYLEVYKRQESIFLEDWPKANKKLINLELEKKMEIVMHSITAILSSREKADIALRWPISKATLEITSDEAFNTIQELSGIVTEYVNAKSLDLKKISGVKKEVRPVFAKLGPDFKEKAGAVANALKTADANVMMDEIEKRGHYSLHTDKGTVDVKAEHFTIVNKVEEGDAAIFKYGKASIDNVITKELKEEAFTREFEHGVQMIRKELGLKKTDKISLGYEANGDMVQILKDNAKSISKNLSAKLSNKLEDGLVKNIDVEGEIVKVSVKKI